MKESSLGPISTIFTLLGIVCKNTLTVQAATTVTFKSVKRQRSFLDGVKLDKGKTATREMADVLYRCKLLECRSQRGLRGRGLDSLDDEGPTGLVAVHGATVSASASAGFPCGAAMLVLQRKIKPIDLKESVGVLFEHFGRFLVRKFHEGVPPKTLCIAVVGKMHAIRHGATCLHSSLPCCSFEFFFSHSRVRYSKHNDCCARCPLLKLPFALPSLMFTLLQFSPYLQ
mmetsp:Transcript_71588/g.142038  ORF Transcript_71588/g.142038 Transcript_71588/m.142038 type:complete len:228 (-) Transcript_71588:336-1019(-)